MAQKTKLNLPNANPLTQRDQTARRFEPALAQSAPLTGRIAYNRSCRPRAVQSLRACFGGSMTAVQEQDMPFATVNGEPLLARVYQDPAAANGYGIVSVHGGAWTRNDHHANYLPF